MSYPPTGPPANHGNQFPPPHQFSQPPPGPWPPAQYPTPYPGQQPKSKKGLIVGIVVAVVLVLAATVGGVLLFTGSDGDKSSGGSGGQRLASSDKAFSFEVPKDFDFEKRPEPPYYVGTATGKEGSVASYGFEKPNGVTDAASLKQFAATKIHSEPLTPLEKTTIDGRPAVTANYTDMPGPSFLAFVLISDDAILRISCFPSRTGDSGKLCDNVLRSIKINGAGT